jgi:homopolymeric O-antigen transport system permease protein
MNKIERKVKGLPERTDNKSDTGDSDNTDKNDNTLSDLSFLEKKPFAVREPSSGISLRLRELLEYHELIYFLVWRDLKVRYKQTALGVAWVAIQPLMTMVVFTIFFGNLAKVPSDGLPYPIFSFAALLPWQLFANALNNSSNSLVNNRDLITKLYFPRLIIPLSSIIAGLVDFFIAFLVLIAMMVYYGIVPTSAVFTLPLFILLTIATSTAVSLWLSALNVEYRDVRYTIPFLTQFWLFLTPIAYPSNLVPEKWRLLYGLNPMAGVVEGFRWALLGTSNVSWTIISVSVFIVIVLLVGGLVYFRRMERTFADIV